MEPGLRRRGADSDVGIGSRSVNSVNATEYETVTLRDKCVCANRGRIAEIIGRNICRRSDHGIEVARVITSPGRIAKETVAAAESSSAGPSRLKAEETVVAPGAASA